MYVYIKSECIVGGSNNVSPIFCAVFPKKYMKSSRKIAKSQNNNNNNNGRTEVHIHIERLSYNN